MSGTAQPQWLAALGDIVQGSPSCTVPAWLIQGPGLPGSQASRSQAWGKEHPYVRNGIKGTPSTLLPVSSALPQNLHIPCMPCILCDTDAAAVAQTSGDLHGRTFKLQNASSGAFVSFVLSGDPETDLAMQLRGGVAEAMPIELVALDSRPNTYYLINRAPGQNKWVSFTKDGSWLYAWYDSQDDAMPVEFVAQGDASYKMRNVWPEGYPEANGKYVSFTGDGLWLQVTCDEADAMPVKLVEVP